MKISDKSIRVANFIIDSIAISVITAFLTFIVYIISPEIQKSHSLALDNLFYVVYIGYYFFFELFTGRTLGKILTKTIVVSSNTGKPNLLRILIRTLLRLVPIDGFSFLFGSIGLHDLLSKTTVAGYKKSS